MSDLFALQYKGKGKGGGVKGKGFQGKCFECGKIGHTAKECWNRKGKGKGGQSTWPKGKGKGKGSAYSMHPEGEGWSSVSWNDYADAWGTETRQETPAGSAASLVGNNFWCMSLRQVKKMKTLKSATTLAKGTPRFHSKNTFGAIANEDEDEEEAPITPTSMSKDADETVPRKAKINQRQRRRRWEHKNMTSTPTMTPPPPPQPTVRHRNNKMKVKLCASSNCCNTPGCTDQLHHQSLTSSIDHTTTMTTTHSRQRTHHDNNMQLHHTSTTERVTLDRSGDRGSQTPCGPSSGRPGEVQEPPSLTVTGAISDQTTKYPLPTTKYPLTSRQNTHFFEKVQHLAAAHESAPNNPLTTTTDDETDTDSAPSLADSSDSDEGDSTRSSSSSSNDGDDPEEDALKEMFMTLTLDFPWWSPEVIAEWMRQRASEVEHMVSIDEYDGPSSFYHNGHKIPTQFKGTKAIEPQAFQEFRAECLQLEMQDLRPGSPKWEDGVRQAIEEARGTRLNITTTTTTNTTTTQNAAQRMGKRGRIPSVGQAQGANPADGHPETSATVRETVPVNPAMSSSHPTTNNTHDRPTSTTTSTTTTQTQVQNKLASPASEKPLDAFRKMGYDEDEGGVNNGMLDHIKKDVWESLPHPIIIDSGASTSVLPLKWCAHVRTIET